MEDKKLSPTNKQWISTGISNQTAATIDSPPPNGRKPAHCLGSREIEGRVFSAWCSSDADDSDWDDFLRSTPLGQFQQSSIWARTKQVEGSKFIRVIVTVEGQIAGGFQILWRRRFKILRIGWISKGPVVWPEDPVVSEFIVDVLRSVVETNKISALIVQPPDLSKIVPTKMPDNLFLPNVLTRVIESTLVVDVTGSLKTIEQRISKYTLTTLRQAVRRGTVIREGVKQDVGTFFQLMLATCKRQEVKPNPATETPLHALWDAAHPKDCIRITFAECEGKTVAGMVWIRFGETITLWKKGWNSTAGECRPNEFLIYEGLKWANACGLKILDFVALDGRTAQALIKGEPLTEEQRAAVITSIYALAASPYCFLRHAFISRTQSFALLTKRLR